MLYPSLSFLLLRFRIWIRNAFKISFEIFLLFLFYFHRSFLSNASFRGIYSISNLKSISKKKLFFYLSKEIFFSEKKKKGYIIFKIFSKYTNKRKECVAEGKTFLETWKINSSSFESKHDGVSIRKSKWEKWWNFYRSQRRCLTYIFSPLLF